MKRWLVLAAAMLLLPGCALGATDKGDGTILEPMMEVKIPPQETDTTTVAASATAATISAAQASAAATAAPSARQSSAASRAGATTGRKAARSRQTTRPTTRRTVGDKTSVRRLIRIMGHDTAPVDVWDTDAHRWNSGEMVRLYWRNVSDKPIDEIRIYAMAYADAQEQQRMRGFDGFSASAVPPTRMGYIFRSQQDGATAWVRLPLLHYPREDQLLSGSPSEYAALNEWDGEEFIHRVVTAKVGERTVTLTDTDKQQNTALMMCALLDTGAPRQDSPDESAPALLDHLRITGINIFYADEDPIYLDEKSSQYALW